MQSSTSLLDFILNLLRDPQSCAQFREHPERMLAEHGLHGVSAHDIHETLPLVTDHRDVHLHAEHGFSTPPPLFPVHGESETHCAVRYLDHITKCYSYNVDNHITTIDDSVHENIWAAGDVSQSFDDTNVLASGHAVAAGGDINGVVTTGNDNAIGSGAAVGTGNVTGSGNALGVGNVAGFGNVVANGAGSTIGNENTVANGAGSAAGNDNAVLNGSHDIAGNGNVTGHVIGSQVATNGGTVSNDIHSVSDSGNTDLHSFGAGSTDIIGNDNTSLTAINSGNGNDAHNVSDAGNSTDINTSTTSGSYDENGMHADHGVVGDSYSASSVQSGYDAHDTAMELHIH